MKKIFGTLLLAIASSLSVIMVAGTPVKTSELPKAALTFLKKHFPGDNVRKAEKDRGHRGMEYEVDLQSGAEIEFRDNGDWKDVKAARGNAVPAAIVPDAIAKHVAANYSDLKIKEISRKRGGYEIELSDGTELKLTSDAKHVPQRQGRPR